MDISTKSSDNHATGYLEEMTMEEVASFDPEIVVLPLGSVEPHGPHLPHGTDTYQVTEVCRSAVARANERDARALLYPTMAAYDDHFPYC